MTIFVLTFLTVALTAGLLWELVRVVASDGRGHRPLPRSHPEPEAGSPRWWVDSWYAAAGRRPGRRLPQG
jgi:hypothetical protein